MSNLPYSPAGFHLAAYCGADPLVPLALLERLDGLIGRLCWSSGGLSQQRRLRSDMADDCRQEAALVLWQIRHKLRALPSAAQREAYVYACVRRAAWRLVQDERHRSAHTVALEELPCEPCDGESGRWQALVGAQELIEQIGWPDLTDALSALPPRDYTVLDLFYTQGLNDPEIATLLNSSPELVKRQRCRVIVKLRKRLQAQARTSEAADHPTRPAREFQ